MKTESKAPSLQLHKWGTIFWDILLNRVVVKPLLLRSKPMTTVLFISFLLHFNLCFIFPFDFISFQNTVGNLHYLFLYQQSHPQSFVSTFVCLYYIILFTFATFHSNQISYPGCFVPHVFWIIRPPAILISEREISVHRCVPIFGHSDQYSYLPCICVALEFAQVQCTRN